MIKTTKIFKIFSFCLLIITSCKNYTGVLKQNVQTGADWPKYGGNDAGNRYSPLDQINTTNVNNLQVAWMYNAADAEPNTRPKEIQCQPIIINGIMYATSPSLKLFALKAETGEELWKFTPSAARSQGFNSSNRGLNFWENGNDKRILYVVGSYIFAVNADTGAPVKSFGQDGRVDLHVGLENDRHDIKDLTITATSPGVVYKNVLVIGSTVSEAGDALPGDIRGFDILTGKLLWSFHTIPRPGEPGYETWPPDAYKIMGGANSWGGMVLDAKRGVVYAGTGAPSVDFYGGPRAGDNLYANCILALDVETGKLKWYYQTVKHDLWDLDIPCAPNLVTVKHNGKLVDAVAQTTKDGNVFLLNRDTGESLFPVEERPVPTNGLPGESPASTQKFPVLPKPLVRQVLTAADVPDSTFFPEAATMFKKRFVSSRSGQKFTPPSIKGNLYTGISGGAEWGGSAADPIKGVLYQNVSEVPWDITMVNVAEQLKASTSNGNALYIKNCSACHGQDRKGNGEMLPGLVDIGKKLSSQQIHAVLTTGRGRMPAFQNISMQERNDIVKFLLNVETPSNQPKDEHSNDGLALAKKDNDFPYNPPFIRGRGGKFKDRSGYPAIKPPWGTLNAIDLNTGAYLWTVPLGEYPELTKKGVPITGTENTSGPMVTAGGLLFIAGTEDEKFRAFDAKTGKVVWEYQLPPGGAFASPSTYMINGKQYIVLAAGGVRGGHKPGGNYIAFKLP